jgi:hypothetical protein
MLDFEWKNRGASRCLPVFHPPSTIHHPQFTIHNSQFKIGSRAGHPFPEVNGFSSGLKGAADWRVGGPVLSRGSSFRKRLLNPHLEPGFLKPE